MVHITDEIVGHTTVKSYEYPSTDGGGMILYEVPLYKILVTGQRADGKRVVKTFKGVRFGVQRNSTGGPFIVGISGGAYNLSASNYMANLGGLEEWDEREGER